MTTDEDIPPGIKQCLNNMVAEKVDILRAGTSQIEWVRDTLLENHPAKAKLVDICQRLDAVQADLQPPYTIDG